MLRSWRLGTAFGIGIYVHWTFLLLPALVFFLSMEGGLITALFSVGVVFTIFGCVVLHELGHALMARRFNIPTVDITLYPIGGVARLGGPGALGLGDRPWAELWIAVAGPAVNVVIASFLALLLARAGMPLFLPFEQLRHYSPMLQFLFCLFSANTMLVLFNLLPAFPMDGGRVFRALLAMRLGHLKATEIAATVGMLMAMLIILAGFGVFAFTGVETLQGNPMLILVAMFVTLAGRQELMMLRWKARQQEMERLGMAGPGWQGQPLDEIDLDPISATDQPITIDRSAVPAEANFSGFTWDRRAGAWIEWRNGQPVHICWTRG